MFTFSRTSSHNYLCVIRDDDEEDGEKAAARQNNTSMLSYFKAGSKTSAQQSNTHQTHRFFTERRLQSLATL